VFSSRLRAAREKGDRQIPPDLGVGGTALDRSFDLHLGLREHSLREPTASQEVVGLSLPRIGQ
jgi:hypothetical protein